MATVRGAEEEPLRRWETVVDQAIREAQERGEFDNLPGQGQRLKLDDNPFAGERAMGFHLLKNADMLPHWMDLEREIGADLAVLDALVAHHPRRFVNAIGSAPDGSEMTSPEPSVGPYGGWLRRFGRWLFRPTGARGGRDRGADGRIRRSAPAAEVARAQARRTYLDASARLDGKIVRYNRSLPDELRWRERPRLEPERAAAAFAAAWPGVGEGDDREPARPSSDV